MNKLLIALLATLASSTAMATGTHCYNCGGTPSTSSSSSTSNATGGKSSATATGGSSKANVSNSGNSTVRNSNTQGQVQGQKQGQSQAARGGNANAAGGKGGAGGSGGQGGAGGVGVGSQGQSSNVSVDSHVAAPKRAAASANAAPLTSSNDTCMGSSSGAIQGPGIGVSVGSTWTDKNCVMLKNSRELWNMGMKEAAIARMCMDADNKEALEVSGVRCPERPQKQSTSSTTAEYTGNDNIVRARLGMPLVKETN